jgi:hypothetical protein
MKLLEETCEMCHLTAQARPKMMLRSARAAGVARPDDAARAEAMADFPDVLLFSAAEMFGLRQELTRTKLAAARALHIARLYRSTSARKFQALAARDAGAAERCFRMFEDWARRKRELKAQERALKLLKSRAAPAGREIKELAAGIDRLLAEDGAEKKRAAEARD